MALTLEQALRNGIETEKAGARFYRRLMDQAADETTRAFFEDLVGQEEAHARALEEMANRLTAEDLPDRPDQNVTSVETMPGWESVDAISMDQALAIALEAEQHAALFYDALSDSCQGDVSGFLRRLARTEEEHVVAVQRLIDQQQG